jgi:hypothetical protein
MKTRELLAGTAIATMLMTAAAMPAAANVMIPLGGYTGPVELNFSNFESFLPPGGGAPVGAPTVGAENFGTFALLSITAPGNPIPLWSPGSDGNVLVGVFDDITVKSVTGTVKDTKTTNTGGIFELYQVPVGQFVPDQGLAGYSIPGCSIGALCYHGITDTASGQQVLTMTLAPGIDPGDPTVTLTASLDSTDNPPTGQAAFDALVSGDPQFGAQVSGKDSFCPNALTSGPNLCPGADGTNWALASQDPISGVVTGVPEPASLAVLGSGLISLGFVGSRRRKNKEPRA